MTKNRMAIIILVCGVLVLFWVGYAVRQKHSKAFCPTAKDYFPTEPGMRWEYIGYGNEYASFSREILYREGNLVQIMVENGGTRMLQIYEVQANKVIRRYVEPEVYDDRNLLTQFGDSSDYTKYLDSVEIQIPAEVGVSWENNMVTHTVLETNGVVWTPAGRFDHVLVIETRHHDSNDTVCEYFAFGVGLVKEEFRSNDWVVTSELVKFSAADE